MRLSLLVYIMFNILTSIAMASSCDSLFENIEKIGDVKKYLSCEENNIQSKIIAHKNVPVGTILAYAGAIYSKSDLPEGWMLCDGSPVPKGKEYKKIEKILALSEWGRNGNTFFLPDLRGLFLRGVDTTDGLGGIPSAGRDPDAAQRINIRTKKIIGGKVGSIQNDATAIPTNNFKIGPPDKDLNHNHGDNYLRKGGGSGTLPSGASDGAISSEPRDLNHIHEISGGDNETRPKNAYINWIIKAY